MLPWTMFRGWRKARSPRVLALIKFVLTPNFCSIRDILPTMHYVHIGVLNIKIYLRYAVCVELRKGNQTTKRYCKYA
jgi:hypothetical protein